MVSRPDTPSAVSVEEHRSRVLSAVTALSPVDVLLADALGRVLVNDVVAHIDVPNFDNSAMDGYAVRFADTASATADSPVSLTVVADLPAGSTEDPPLQAGQAARIMTGAPMPTAADCVVPVEDTDAFIGSNANATNNTNTVRVFAAPQPAAHIRRIGTDACAGDIVLSAGRTLNARDLSAAAATGSRGLRIIPAPRVGVLSTGSELRAPGEPLDRGQIHDSNSLLLAASVAECGAVPVLIGSVPDDDDSLRAAFEENAADVDAFVTSGGVSVGAYDVVKAVLAPLGVWFGPVRMQPGKPQGFGDWPGTAGSPGIPIFALPGNPVSVFVSFEQFVRPALLALQGRKDLLRPVVHAVAASSWRSPRGRAQFMPAVALQQPDGSFTVRPASEGGSGSYLVASLAGANAFAFVPESVTEVREGDLLAVTLVP
ncbi:MAG: molybdopterin molybdotransferase MoeA [Microbacteriaceae bacterium]|nr:molybdopterin molybdotransferase MoeA [Microbacteriaceae bacterium]